MKAVKRIVIGITLVVLAATSTCAAVFAVSNNVASDIQRADTIRANCKAAQSVMQRIARSDKSDRLNRGPAYEKMLKLMYSFNARVAANNKSFPELGNITAKFEKESENFRNDYNQYDDAINRAIQTDCVNQPVTFYEALVDARTKRALTHTKEMTLDDLMNQYQRQITKVAKLVGTAR